MCHVDHHNSFMQNINLWLNPTPSFKLFNQNRRFILTTNGKPHMRTRSPMVTWQTTSRGIKRSRSWPLYLWSVISQKRLRQTVASNSPHIAQESIYYKTYAHVTDDVTCRKWWLFKETHAARIPVHLPACFFISLSLIYEQLSETTVSQVYHLSFDDSTTSRSENLGCRREKSLNCCWAWQSCIALSESIGNYWIIQQTANCSRFGSQVSV